MSLRRVPPIIQGVAQIRNWVVENVPGADSMLGYDLFLKLGNDAVVGQPLSLATLAQGLPYPADAVADQLRRFEQHGMVELIQDADKGLTLRPTQRLFTLLDHYSLVFESKFIVRDELRSQQLLVQSEHLALAGLARILYDRMYDLGWLYLHNYGSTCFMMASLVRRLAELHGHKARIAVCYAEIERTLPEGIQRYSLGGKGFAKPGQIEGHAACVIDDALLVDFGLGTVRKHYRREFYWGAIGDYRRDGAAIARLALPGGDTMTWKDDWQSPHGDAELERCAAVLDGLVNQYLQRFR
jgi:hypothetical protein